MSGMRNRAVTTGTLETPIHLKPLPDSDRVLRRISSMSNSELHELCERSYLHTNGFAKIVLNNFPDGSALRLHVWMDAEAGDEGHVHSHRWSFRSAILCGELEQCLYRIEDGGTFGRYQYSSQHHGKSYTLQHTGYATPVLTAQFVMLDGFSYLLRPGAFHTIKANSPMTASLVLTGPPETEENTVVAEGEPTLERHSSALTVGELSKITKELSRIACP
ncbi:hypothetical protein QF035_002326 [Streptomyces umbrinus]|uniref:Uncharacterized protein n=1 Tax=Streptomyces umbrinus TaxID=67370 RepID=A0ABU0SQF0_9ACTN|nr:hypothetical protein [Streptomyces umbrinus]MDQ1024744.1 hypothetical protein [Streptomyces umbrinus]